MLNKISPYGGFTNNQFFPVRMWLRLLKMIQISIENIKYLDYTNDDLQYSKELPHENQISRNFFGTYQNMSSFTDLSINRKLKAFTQSNLILTHNTTQPISFLRAYNLPKWCSQRRLNIHQIRVINHLPFKCWKQYPIICCLQYNGEVYSL